jgi:hypothetical protein
VTDIMIHPIKERSSAETRDLPYRALARDPPPLTKAAVKSSDNIAHRALKALVGPVSVTSAGNSLPDWSIRGQ